MTLNQPVEGWLEICQHPVIRPRSMLVGDTLVEPSAGGILSPEYIAASLDDRLGEARMADLQQLAEVVQGQ